MEHIFRAYDVRGVFNVDVTAEVAARIGMAFGTYLGEGRVLLARDPRVTSEIFERAFCSGLASTGVDVYLGGMLPIPVANFAVARGDYSAGAYVTASHNPPEYNGVRFRRADGTGYTRENQEVKRLFFSDKLRLPEWSGVGEIVELNPKQVLQEYQEYLLARLSLERELRVVLDLGNGAAGVVAPYVFRKAGARVTTLNAQPDGTFPGRKSEPDAESLADLARVVPAVGAAFGAGYDGDADRVVFVDDLGRVVQTEKVGIIIAREILREKGGGTVVANVECSSIVEEELSRHGGKVERVRVGDVFVCEAIKQYGAVFAMETSAHYFYPDFYPFDDPILISLKLASILSERGERLSKLVDEIPSYPKLHRNFPCDDRIKFRVMDRIIQSLREKGYTLDLTDGARIVFEDGWALLRPSNTSPLIRASIEARTEERVRELLSLVERELEEAKDSEVNVK
ncbi:MAG: phosphoglucomutase [Euryarchaeota archaeon]|nr:phosphoglucomutase [Euryarchaeota archaeon]